MSLSPSQPPSPAKSSRSRRSFFDALPAPVLEYIARNLSAFPRHHAWETFVDATDVVALLTSFRPLRAACIDHFRTLTLIDELGSRSPAGAVAHIGEIPFAAVLRAVGPDLKELVVDYTREESGDRAWVSALAAHCVHVTALKVRRAPFGLDLLLRAARGRLRALALASDLRRSRVNFIVQGCAGLRELWLGADTFLFPVVRAIGDSLEQLSFRVSVFAPAGIRHVKKHCRRLRGLHFIVTPGEMSAEMAALVVSYGRQLETLRFDDGVILPEHLRVIVQICPNVVIDAHLPREPSAEVLEAVEMGIIVPGWAETPIFVDAVCAMGDKLSALRWSGEVDYRDMVPETFGCCNLRKICLTDMKESTVDMLAGILGKGMSNLTDVELSFADVYAPHDEEEVWLLGPDAEDEARYSYAAVTLLAKQCEYVKRLSLKSVPVEHDAFEAFCSTNLELESVKLCFKQGQRDSSNFEDWEIMSPEADLHLLQATDTFSRCTKLQSMDIADLSYSGVEEGGVVFPKIEAMCERLRDRMVSVVVCGVHYLA